MTPAERAAAPAGQADWPLLCGQVVDAQGEPVAGARVTLARISFTLLADPQGRFCLSAPAGSQELRVEAPGYAARTEPATFAKDAPELRVRMQAAR